MSTQVQQVFYIQDPVEKYYNYPIKRLSAEFYDPHNENNATEDDINGQFIHDMSFHSLIENQDHEVSWFRDDIPTKLFPIENS